MNSITQDDEAQKKYEKYKSLDPFPEIKPALLNSADIIDYIITTGMICPFDLSDEKNIKHSSIALRLLWDYIYWNKNGKEVSGKITENKEFKLKSNTIAFVSLKEHIRLPYYIAARFNLKIDNVYRGLLLGTGPLIDPGFDGILSFPLHNLTKNDYTFMGGERIIWVEFTKLSTNQLWVKDIKSTNYNREGRYRIPDNKHKDHNVRDYLREAEKHRDVSSTLPNIVKRVKKAINYFKIRQYFLASVAIISIGALIVGIFNLQNNLIKGVEKKIRDQKIDFQKSIDEQKEDIHKIEGEIDESKYLQLDDRIKELEKQIKELKNSNKE